FEYQVINLSERDFGMSTGSKRLSSERLNPAYEKASFSAEIVSCVSDLCTVVNF
ncbi:hypothetical protein M569_12491, partial [Genlisea aurea]